MDAKAMLEELLASSRGAAEKGLSLAEDKLGVPESGEQRDAMLSGMTKGALAAGAAALLLGTSGGRKLTGTALTLGGLAAVGGIAYKAYNEWQSSQGTAGTHTGTPIGELGPSDSEQRSQLLLKAMISAARADGHMDDAEKQRIRSRVDELGLDAETVSFIEQQIREPLDAGQLAAAVSTQEEAAEVYLVSVMVLDVDSEQERRYLDRLSGALNLAPGLAATLESQLQQQV